MNDARDWVEELEARLERQLEAFLAANPEQEALLAEQEARDRQQRLGRLRLRLRQDAELQRQGLLRLAGEIRGWRQRVEKARAASADQLAARAEAHIGDLMEEGRNRWKSLEELGQRFGEVEQELNQLRQKSPGQGWEARPRALAPVARLVAIRRVPPPGVELPRAILWKRTGRLLKRIRSWRPCAVA